MRLDYSAVIAADRPDKPLASLEGLSRLPAPERPREVFVCVGRNPSRQRNLGVRQCETDLVYFLDDDSVVCPGTVTHLAPHFGDPRTAVAGGPNLVPPDASPFEKSVNAVLASWMGSFSVRNRYASIGSVKEATEKDLILCNMMVRRRTFLAEGGFREDLYPNEENEFLNRLMHSQYRLVYDPGAVVFRHRRKNLGAFCHQAFRYGRGRAQQMKVYPCLSDMVHLIPAFFLFYVLSLPAPLALPKDPPGLWALAAPYWYFPIYLFLLLSFGTAASVLSWDRDPLDILKVPFLIFLRHCFYGIGLVAGLLMPIPKRKEGPIRVFKALFKGGKARLTEIKERRSL